MTQGFNFQTAYVLHTRPYLETSLIAEMLTKEQGRISLVCRGARRKNCRHKGLLQAFVPIIISSFGRGELYTLGSIEANGISASLTGKALFCGFYINELLLRLLQRQDPYPGLFSAYHRTLADLAKTEEFEPLLRLFEQELLAELGYALTLNREVEKATPIDAESWYYFNPDSGFRLATLPKPEALNLFSGKSLLAMHLGDFSDLKILSDAKRLNRLALAPLIGQKPLKSRELW